MKIAFYCPPQATIHPWDGESARHEGCGGSEEALVYLSEALVGRGHEVTVYAIMPHLGKVVRGVLFLPWELLEGEQGDALICWRLPNHPPKATFRSRFLWLHDIIHPELLPRELICTFDGILWLSQFQRFCAINSDNAPLLEDPTRNFFLPNGLLPEQFPQMAKDPYRCLYASSYLRGLEQLLQVWPRIKAEEPRATLDIYYGYPNDHRPLLSPLLEEVEAQRSLGVLEHGRIGQESLAKAFCRSSLLLYPCTFPETFCITTLKAAYAGCIPVVHHVAALRETVPHGYHCQQIYDFGDLAIEALRQVGTEDDREMRERCHTFASGFAWSQIARRWEKLLTRSSGYYANSLRSDYRSLRS